jgi:hypothetical protein
MDRPEKCRGRSWKIVEDQWLGCSMVAGLAIWLRVAGLKMGAQQEWAGIATDGTIRGDAVYQKLSGSGLEEFAWSMKRGALDLARRAVASRGRASVRRKRESSAKRGY